MIKNIFKIISHYDGVIVDLDNTLFNYSYAHSKALEYTLNHHNISMSEYTLANREIKSRALRVNHHNKSLIFKCIQENLGLPLRTAMTLHSMYSEKFNDIVFADDEMYTALVEYKNNSGKIIGCTNFYSHDQLLKLESTGYLELIDKLVTSEEFEVEKPSAVLMNQVKKLIDYDVNKTYLMIGDSKVDEMFAENETNIDYLPYNCSKTLIAVAGLSGCGKTTLTSYLKDTMNADIIEGDGYHKYERNHPEWTRLTHYNPEANNLVQLGLDIRSIYHDIGEVEIPCYMHDTGTFTSKPSKKSSSFNTLIIDGLHTLYPEVSGNYIKYKIFIDSDKTEYQKIARDSAKRGKTKEDVIKSIADRKVDEIYINKQKEYANILIEIRNDAFTITLGDDIIAKEKIIKGHVDDLHLTVHKLLVLK